jgi:hypothetical protein
MFDASSYSWLKKKWFEICALAVVGFITATAMALLKSEVQANYSSQLQANHLSSTLIISGKNAQDGKEWDPESTVQGKQFMVLFTPALLNQPGDRDYWERVALQVSALEPRIKFVGQCSSETTCETAKSASSDITYLSAVDPSVMRNLSIANKRGLVLFYRISPIQGPNQSQIGTQSTQMIGGKLIQPLKISRESQDIVDQLMLLSNQVGFR